MAADASDIPIANQGQVQTNHDVSRKSILKKNNDLPFYLLGIPLQALNVAARGMQGLRKIARVAIANYHALRKEFTPCCLIQSI